MSRGTAHLKTLIVISVWHLMHTVERMLPSSLYYDHGVSEVIICTMLGHKHISQHHLSSSCR